MPFLRRRGVMASESDMRRHTLIDANAHPAVAPPLPRLPTDDFLSPDSIPDRPRNGANGDAQSARSVSLDGSDAPNSSGLEPRPDPYDRPESPPVQEETPKHRRFSMLRFRNASDSQLSARMKRDQQQQQLAEEPPPMPEPPTIITTPPTTIDPNAQHKKSRMKIPMRLRRSGEVHRDENEEPTHHRLRISSGHKKERRKSMNERALSSNSRQTVTFEEPPKPSRPSVSNSAHSQPDSEVPSQANRFSESSRSEVSISEKPMSTTSSAASFFRLPRRKPKQPEPLFPLAHLPQKGRPPLIGSNSSLVPESAGSRPSSTHDRPSLVVSPVPGLNKPGGSPATALFRPGSQHSGQSSPTRTHLGLRGRSSTLSSLNRASIEEHPQVGASRTSSSIGRKSFGDLLGLGRIRQANADALRHGALSPATPGSNASANNSLQIPREQTFTLPERIEDETPAKYLARVESEVPRAEIAGALSKPADSFFATALRSYMRRFGFFEEPMDMAIRKLLMEAHLPKETQQIDRCLQAFANRYHECNPGIYSGPDQAYFIAFSILILHTDVFNQNNKYKMQKADYLKNTKGEGIFDDVLECFYDNISYTPFIHMEEDSASEGANGSRTRKSIFPNGPTEPMRKSKEPIDPYTIILEGKLDTLRAPVKDEVPLEDNFNYLGTAKGLNLKMLQQTFFKTGVLQIVSARSRPDAFMTEKTAINPQEAHPGIVDIKVTKVGLLWRKDAKKKKARSPWQEWGAVLTGAQLYFFRNTTWIKNLIHQHETHLKNGNDGVPLIFKPPLEQFKPDALMSTEGAVALFDSEYKKHKNAFVYIRYGGLEEVLLAQSEEDRNDWLAKLNYAATFRTSGVRMRGVIGANYDGQARRAIRRLDNGEATQLIQTPTGEVSINRGRIDQSMARDILVARREVMREKMGESFDKLQVAQKHLDIQLRNARHLLLLAPIQDKTREQVCAGASKIIAQLKWSRVEIWRLKCYSDILQMDLAEEEEVNGDLSQYDVDTVEGPNQILKHKESKTSSHKELRLSPRSRPALPVAASSDSVDKESIPPTKEGPQTPPTAVSSPGLDLDIPPLNFESPASDRKASVSSITSSARPSRTTSPSRGLVSSSSKPEQDAIEEESHDVEDAGERRVLEQAGLLSVDASRGSDGRPSSAVASEDSDHHRGHHHAGHLDKDKFDGSKIRRSLHRTLRDGAGHLAHHRSRKGKDSASSATMSDETVREEVLSRGEGSFTVHGKKASVINFGEELQHLSNDERIKQRKNSPLIDEPSLGSPASFDDDFHSVLSQRDASADSGDRRGSTASMSTATARSFRELRRKYSSSRTPKPPGLSNLTVPSDEDSDAALSSYSDGRRTPLPPLEDEEEGDEDHIRRSMFFTPEPPGSPVAERGSAQADPAQADDEESDDEKTQEKDHMPNPTVQTVGA